MNTKYIIWGFGALAVAALGYYVVMKMRTPAPATVPQAAAPTIGEGATIFKLGDTDDDITVIQRLMGIEETGEFDKTTEAKVLSVFGKKTITLAEVSARRAEFLPKG
jgi:hypothetical protein